MQPSTVEIPLSKGKLVLACAGSLLFVLLGLWLLLAQPDIGTPLFDNPVVKYGAATAAVIFFGAMLIYLLTKLRDKRPGLVVDATGILDNSSALAHGFIRWEDVRDLRIVQVMSRAFVAVEVSNPEGYTARQKSLLKRKSMEYNLAHYGAPILLSTVSLKCSPPRLKALLDEALARYKNN